MSTRWREIRSAQTPPRSRKTTSGISRARRTKPRSVGVPISSTAKASATSAIAVPRVETLVELT